MGSAWCLVSMLRFLCGDKGYGIDLIDLELIIHEIKNKFLLCWLILFAFFALCKLKYSDLPKVINCWSIYKSHVAPEWARNELSLEGSICGLRCSN